MPSKYKIRNYQPDSFYHIYNKGLGKSEIFLDDEDYQKFLYYLEIYLSPNSSKDPNLPKRLLSKNLSQDVELLSYLLLPDHFHLLLHQKSLNGISKLLKQVLNGYTYYYNKKYKSSGPLFAGKFKSVKIEVDQILPITHYLHTHPGILWLADSYKSYPWSSNKDYLSEGKASSAYLKDKQSFLSKNYVLSLFPTIKDYEKAMGKELKIDESIKGLCID